MPTEQRFKDLLGRMGWQGNAVLAYLSRRAKYAEPHRFHHTWTHIEECYELLDLYGHLMDRPDAVEMALLDHDFIYNIHRKDNELRSAEHTERFLNAGGVTIEHREPVSRNMMATIHDGKKLTGDEAFVADIDMAVLGSRGPRYTTYASQVEQEYRYDGSISEKDWCVGRGVFLHRLLDRAAQGQPVFHKATFQERFERRAHENMRAELESLKARLDKLSRA